VGRTDNRHGAKFVQEYSWFLEELPPQHPGPLVTRSKRSLTRALTWPGSEGAILGTASLEPPLAEFLSIYDQASVN
jgi:hypothetical protein